MKKLKLSIFALLLGVLSSYSQTDGTVVFSVRTVTNLGEYSPKNVLAIWVETSGGTFIRSLKVMAGARIQQLYTWKVASGLNTTDAITGATLNSHSTHNITWNCRNLSNVLVNDGDYRIRVEFTEEHVQGPIYNYSFTKGTSSQTINFPDQAYFKDASLTYTVAADINEFNENIFVRVYPNPFSEVVYFAFSDNENTHSRIEIYNVNGSLIFSNENSVSIGEFRVFSWDGKTINGQDAAKGIYSYIIHSEKKNFKGTILKIR